MKIPYQQLSPDALQGVLDDYVLREGTDYGDFVDGQVTPSLEAKRAAVLRALQTGAAELWFDAASETTTVREPE